MRGTEFIGLCLALGPVVGCTGGSGEIEAYRVELCSDANIDEDGGCIEDEAGGTIAGTRLRCEVRFANTTDEMATIGFSYRGSDLGTEEVASSGTFSDNINGVAAAGNRYAATLTLGPAYRDFLTGDYTCTASIGEVTQSASAAGDSGEGPFYQPRVCAEEDTTANDEGVPYCNPDAPTTFAPTPTVLCGAFVTGTPGAAVSRTLEDGDGVIGELDPRTIGDDGWLFVVADWVRNDGTDFLPGAYQCQFSVEGYDVDIPFEVTGS